MKSLSVDKARLLGIIARRIVPEIPDPGSAGERRFFETIDTTLAERPLTVHRQFALFLGVVRWIGLLRHAGRFEGLDPGRQDGVLRWLQDCPIRLLARGFWGLKTLVFLGYYGQPESWSTIGYSPFASETSGNPSADDSRSENG